MAGLRRITRDNIVNARTTVPGVQDEIYNPLYDYQAYPAAGALQLTFFSTPIGQGTTSALNASGAKTEADTNMQTAGQLPAGNRLYCTGIEVVYFPGVLPTTATITSYLNDVSQIAKTGWLNFRIQNRSYALDAPLGNFPPDARLDGFAATGLAAESTSYAQFGGRPYPIVPVYISSTQAFSVQLNWPALVPTPSTVAGRIGIRLRGRFVRDAQ